MRLRPLKLLLRHGRTILLKGALSLFNAEQAGAATAAWLSL
jgi:hypothetical protein